MVDSNAGSSGQTILRQSIDAAVKSLGVPIYKTITWYLESRGVFSDPKKIDINFFYSTLREIVGPGADLIMEETSEHLQKLSGSRTGRDMVRFSPLERIQKIMEVSGA
jgi:hypothetical protein